MVSALSLDVASTIWQEHQVERQRRIFVSVQDKAGVMLTTAAICDACDNDLTRLESFLKQRLRLSDDAAVQVKAAAHDNFDVFLHHQLQYEVQPVSDFLLGVERITMMVTRTMHE